MNKSLEETVKEHAMDKELMKYEEIDKRIIAWGLERGLTEFNVDNENRLFAEELQEFNDALEADDTHELIDSQCDMYVVYTQTMSKALNNTDDSQDIKLLHKDNPAIYFNIPHVVEALGFDFNQCMDECLKEIESRKQDPAQKKEWEKNGITGKFQKWKEQPENTLYKADYSKCLLHTIECVDKRCEV